MDDVEKEEGGGKHTPKYSKCNNPRKETTSATCAANGFVVLVCFVGFLGPRDSHLPLPSLLAHAPFINVTYSLPPNTKRRPITTT